MQSLVKWGWACAIAGAAFFIFAGTFSNPFLHDDIAIIGENPLVRESGRLLEAFQHDYWAVLETNEARDRLYRPLTIASFALNHAAGGLNPLGYRIVNALFHAFACLALFLLCARFGLSRGAAGAVSLLFALHPVHTEAVNAVVARADLMAAVGVFAGLGLLMGVALPWAKPDEEKKVRRKKTMVEAPRTKAYLRRLASRARFAFLRFSPRKSVSPCCSAPFCGGSGAGMYWERRNARLSSTRSSPSARSASCSSYM